MTREPVRTVRVSDCMTRGVVTVYPEALARGAADMMRTRRLRHLPVVDHGGRLVGIVTDRDLRQVVFDPAIQERAGDLAAALKALRIRDVMTWGVVTVAPSMEIREAARRMRERKIGALPVVDGERLVGILTETDVLRALERLVVDGRVPDSARWIFARR